MHLKQDDDKLPIGIIFACLMLCISTGANLDFAAAQVAWRLAAPGHKIIFKISRISIACVVRAAARVRAVGRAIRKGGA